MQPLIWLALGIIAIVRLKIGKAFLLALLTTMLSKVGAFHEVYARSSVHLSHK